MLPTDVPDCVHNVWIIQAILHRVFRATSILVSRTIFVLKKGLGTNKNPTYSNFAGGTSKSMKAVFSVRPVEQL